MNILYAKYGRDRKPEYQIKTTIFEENGEKFVKKAALNKDAKTHVRNIYNNFELLNAYYSGVDIVKPQFTDESIVFQFEKGITFESILLDIVRRNEKNIFLNKLKWYNSFIYSIQAVFSFKYKSDFIDLFGEFDILKGVDAPEISNIDLNFDNLILDDKRVCIIDYEWVFNFPIPIGFIMYRAVKNFYYKHYRYTHQFIGFNEILEIIDVSDEEAKAYEEMYSSFHNFVFVQDNLDYSKIVKGFLKTNKIINEDIFEGNYEIQLFYDLGAGFNEELSLRHEIGPKQGTFNIKVTFDLSNIKGIKRLRLDPINSSSVIDLKQLYFIDIENNRVFIDSVHSNADFKFGDKYIFLHDDPQIYINNVWQERYVKLELELEFIEIDINKSDWLLEVTRCLDEKISVSTEIEKLVETLKEENKNYKSRLEDAEKKIKDQQTTITEYQGQIKEIKKLTEEQSELIFSIRQKNQEILDSVSWKITRPIRVAGKLFIK